MDPEFQEWRDEAASVCAASEIECPDDDTLFFMFEDGLDPEDTARESARARYARDTSRAKSHDLQEIVASGKSV